MVGTIIKGIGGFYYVKSEGKVIECKARGKFRHKELTPVIGDSVEIEKDNDKGVITDIHKRRNLLIRPVVSNVTQAFMVFALKNPDINMELLNKFLIQCEFYDIDVVICLNKLDLAAESDYIHVTDMLACTGYKIYRLNAKEGIGVDDLKNLLRNNVTVICGPSGAGKSTIINKLAGRDVMETGDISVKLGRGKHTTRHSELIEVEDGYLVDTPGFSSLEMDFISKDDLQYCFPEFKDYLGYCKFTGCMHHKEPGCAVKEAIIAGNIDEKRYEFYVKMLEEILNRRNKR
jgi:ribosome biogenesis GTPase / thiamine phosphate phosphatase